MSPALIAAILWVLAVSAVAMLPQRFHKRLGFPLLALLPGLLIWLGLALGPLWALALLAGGLSIYRYPARHYGRALWRRLRG